MNNRIAVIFTGGTIGSRQNDKQVGLDSASKSRVISLYEQETGGGVEFDEFTPIQMLSENVQPTDLKAILACVRAVNPEKYDGVIITHGTDSLCFTANYLSLALSDFPLPVVLVSSLYPLPQEGEEMHSLCNGVENFKGAVTYIGKGVKGVFVSFKNEGELCKIHLGSRIMYLDEYTGYCRSVYNEHFAEITQGGKVVFPRTRHNPQLTALKKNTAVPVSGNLDERVMLITARALLDFSLYGFSKKRPSAVIVELYHSDTACTVGGKFSLIEFALFCKKHKIPLIIAPVNSSANVYSSMSSLPENIIISKDITLEMTITKVMCALGDGLSADSYLEKNFFFEKLK